MLRVNVTCSYSIVVEEHELEEDSRASSRAHSREDDGRRWEDGSELQEDDRHEDWDSGDSDAESVNTEGEGCTSDSEAETANALALVPYGTDPALISRRRRAQREQRQRRQPQAAQGIHVYEAGTSGSATGAAAGGSANATEDSAETTGPDEEGQHAYRSQAHHFRDSSNNRHHCIQGEVVLGQPTVMYRTQPHELSGPAAAAASAAAAAVAAASGPSQRIVVQAAARAAAAAAANSAAEQMEAYHRQSHPEERRSSEDADYSVDTDHARVGNHSTEQTEEDPDTGATSFLQAMERSRRSAASGAAAPSPGSFFAMEALRRAEEEVDSMLQSEAEAQQYAEDLTTGHSSRHRHPEAYPGYGSGYSAATTSSQYNPRSLYMDFWDTPESPADPYGISSGDPDSLDPMGQHLAADLTALQNETSLFEQIRFHEAMRQQMTLPEDIAQAGPSAAAGAILAGGSKCLFGRRAAERKPLPPSRPPLFGRRAVSPGGLSQSFAGACTAPLGFPAKTPVSVSFDSASMKEVTAHRTPSGRRLVVLTTGLSSNRQTPVDTPHLMEMRDGAEVLIVDPAEPFSPAAEDAMSRLVPRDGRDSRMASCFNRPTSRQAGAAAISAHWPASDGAQRPVSMERRLTASRSETSAGSGMTARHSGISIPVGTRAPSGSCSSEERRMMGRRQLSLGAATDPKMLGANLTRGGNATTLPRIRPEPSTPKYATSGRRNGLLGSNLRLEPRAGAASHGRSAVAAASAAAAAATGPNSWQQQHPATASYRSTGGLQHQRRRAGHQAAPSHSQRRAMGLNISGHGTGLHTHGSQHPGITSFTHHRR